MAVGSSSNSRDVSTVMVYKLLYAFVDSSCLFQKKDSLSLKSWPIILSVSLFANVIQEYLVISNF